MTIFGCPGSQKFKQPQPEDIKCKACGAIVEIWTDEFQAICPKCGKAVSRSVGDCCLDWCKEAKECVGDEVYNRYMNNKNLKKGKGA